MNAQFSFSTVQPKDSPQEMEQVRELLAANHLEFDNQVEQFTVCWEKERVIACAGLDKKTIKDVAVAEEFRGNSLSLQLGSEVVKLAAEKGQLHLFLYTRPSNVRLFQGWGFYPLVEVPKLVVFMENTLNGIKKYCDTLSSHRRPGNKIGCIVLNANPFTLGHLYLVEKAARECDWLHVFVVGEDASIFSYADRYALVSDGIKNIDNVTLHHGSDYIISRATFPGYFLREEAVVDRGWTGIDLLLFRQYIAPALGITHRYVGTEPFDTVTNKYNTDMECWLQHAASPAPPISVVAVPRTCIHAVAISASAVRKLSAQKDFTAVKELVPTTTFEFLKLKFPAEVKSVQKESNATKSQ